MPTGRSNKRSKDSAAGGINDKKLQSKANSSAAAAAAAANTAYELVQASHALQAVQAVQHLSMGGGGGDGGVSGGSPMDGVEPLTQDPALLTAASLSADHHASIAAAAACSLPLDPIPLDASCQALINGYKEGLQAQAITTLQV